MEISSAIPVLALAGKPQVITKLLGSSSVLTKEAKAHEIKINEVLFDYRENKIDLNSAKEKLEMIKSESHLNNLKKAIDDLLRLNDLGNITTSM